MINGSYFGSRGVSGSFRSSTDDDYETAYNLIIDSSGVAPATNGTQKHVGRSIRRLQSS